MPYEDVTLLETVYVPLHVLLSWRWEDNPKLHQTLLIAYSIREYGFNDPVGVDLTHQMITEGHGRLELLEQLFKVWLYGDPLPKHIGFAEEFKDWMVPTVQINFDSKEKAEQYALLHNRSGVSSFSTSDYDMTRLGKALQSAAQSGLPGFSDDEILSSATGGPMSQPIAQVPDLPSVGPAAPKSDVFDPSKLPDAPGYQAEQAPQAFIVMVSAKTQEGLIRMLSILSLGDRASGAHSNMRFASLDGEVYVDRWESALSFGKPIVKTEAPKSTDILPGQMTLAGEVVENTSLLPQALMPETASPLSTPPAGIIEPSMPGGDFRAGVPEPVSGGAHLGTLEAPSGEVPETTSPWAKWSRNSGAANKPSLDIPTQPVGVSLPLAAPPLASQTLITTIDGPSSEITSAKIAEVAAVVSLSNPELLAEPAWVGRGQICPKCAGSRYTDKHGAKFTWCTVCNACGDKAAWDLKLATLKTDKAGAA